MFNLIFKALLVVFVIGFFSSTFYVGFVFMLAILTKDPKWIVRAEKIRRLLERRKVNLADKGAFVYDENSGSYPLLREAMEQIKADVEKNFLGQFKMEFYDTWREETELTEPYNFYWIGKKISKKTWFPGAEHEVWLKVIVGFFENTQDSTKRLAYCHFENNEIKSIADKHLQEYLKSINVKETKEF